MMLLPGTGLAAFCRLRRQKGEQTMKLICGLGNPGKKYEQTKHNMGFQVIDRLEETYHIPVNKIKHRALEGNGIVAGEKLVLLKPQTFMNLSGESVKEAMQFYKLSVEDLIVIYDDISLPVGAVRIREKGSAGGHNGMKNIIAHLGSSQFVRIRVGVGAKPAEWDLADYVLSGFAANEQKEVQDGIALAARAVDLLVRQGLQQAMNQVNTSVKAKKEPSQTASEGQIN